MIYQMLDNLHMMMKLGLFLISETAREKASSDSGVAIKTLRKRRAHKFSRLSMNKNHAKIRKAIRSR